MELDFGSVQEHWADRALSMVTGDGAALYGLRDPLRFARDLDPDSAGLRYSLREEWNSEVGTATFSPLYSVLPRYSLAGQAVKSIAPGWDVGLGLRRKDYGHAAASIMAFGAQRQLGPLRGGLTLYSGYADSAPPAPSQRIQLMYDYGRNSSIGLSYTSGRELEAGITPLGLTPVGVRDWTLSGSHWLAPQWALTYNLTNSETNNFRRQGLRLGIRHTF